MDFTALNELNKLLGQDANLSKSFKEVFEEPKPEDIQTVYELRE